DVSDWDTYSNETVGYSFEYYGGNYNTALADGKFFNVLALRKVLENEKEKLVISFWSHVSEWLEGREGDFNDFYG
ncbi:MAG: hypothetical protein KAQ92_02400, partial [Candidatus Aenigmarchaeota archaeon]|nr:hypothetical protein [Candidatus Aenigmarchaeota archaeon]